MEKVTKNLYKMLRHGSITFQEFSLKFDELMESGQHIEPVRLDTAYHREMERYVSNLHRTVKRMQPDKDTFVAFCEQEATNLNRLQKMKNTASYKKEKHKKRALGEGWQ